MSLSVSVSRFRFPSVFRIRFPYPFPVSVSRIRFKNAFHVLVCISRIFFRINSAHVACKKRTSSPTPGEAGTCFGAGVARGAGAGEAAEAMSSR